jgi:hypothetical protein
MVKSRRQFRFSVAYLLMQITWLSIAFAAFRFLRIDHRRPTLLSYLPWNLIALVAWYGAMGAVLGGIFFRRMGIGAILTLVVVLLTDLASRLHIVHGYIGNGYLDIGFGEPLIAFFIMLGLRLCSSRDSNCRSQKLSSGE